MALHEGATSWGLEYSVHGCPSQLRKEVQTVFPGADLDKLLIVPTCQRAAMDLVQTGEPVEKEKDLLLEKFMGWAQKACDKLNGLGHWSDFVDPCSGLPMVHRDTQNVYPEVESMSVIKGYKTTNAGCCKVLLHPVWDSAVYPASMVSCAPLEVLLEVLKGLE